MTSNKPAIHVLEIPQNFQPCLRQGPLELGSADLHQLRCLILFYFYRVFFVLGYKTFTSWKRSHSIQELTSYPSIGNHHLGADKFQHFSIEKKGSREGEQI